MRLEVVVFISLLSCVALFTLCHVWYGGGAHPHAMHMDALRRNSDARLLDSLTERLTKIQRTLDGQDHFVVQLQLTLYH